MVKNKSLKKISRKKVKVLKRKEKKRIIKRKIIKKSLKKKSLKQKHKKSKRISKPKKIIKKVVVSSKEESNFKTSVINLLKKPFGKRKKILPRASIGIAGVDKMTNGGFEGGSINLIAGGSGSGKSIFALQFLLEGIKKGEKVLYITFEEKKEEFYRNMMKLGFDLVKQEKTGKFVFLEYSPEKVKMMLDEGGGSIETLVFRHEVKRIVFDSITSFSLLFDDEQSKRQSMLGLFDIIGKWNCTTLLTVQYNPSDQKVRSFSSVEFEVDSIILLYALNVKNTRKKFIEVLKMRGTNHSKDIHSFEIEKGGIKIGKKANIKKFG